MKTAEKILEGWERVPRYVKALTGVAGTLGLAVLANKITGSPTWVFILIGGAVLLLTVFHYSGSIREHELTRCFGYEFDENQRVEHRFREKIAVLLPLKEGISYHPDDDISRDTKLQLAGLLDLLYRDPALFTQFDIRWFSSANSADVAKNHFLRERQSGTRYFFCTMTDACQGLAKAAIAKEIDKDTAYLICSVTSARSEAFEGENILRYYIRTEDELKALFDHANRVGWLSKKLCFVKGTHGYAADAGDQLRAYLTGSHSLDEIAVDGNVSIDQLKNAISAANAEVYLVAAYGRTLDTVIQAFDSLRALNRDSHVLFTHTAASALARCGYEPVVSPGQWACTIPSCMKWNDLKQTDVISFLTEKAFEHLLRCIRDKDEQPFHKRWAKSGFEGVNRIVKFLPEADADSEVLVRCELIQKMRGSPECSRETNT